MIPAKAEITIKINELPSEVKISGKESTFEVKDDAITYRVTCKTKSLNKVTKAIEEFKHPFVIAISGKIIKNLNKGLIGLEQVGMQVFEKKPKETEPPEEGSEQVELPAVETQPPSPPDPVKTQPVIIFKKRKSLLAELPAAQEGEE